MNITAPTDHSRSACQRLLGREAMLSGLALFFLGMVWIPATLIAVSLLTCIPCHWAAAGIGSMTLLALLSRNLFGRLSRQETLLLIAVVLGAIGVCGALSMYFYDGSADGRWYHADAILGLLHGANPIYGVIPATQPVWANHYPKGAWYFSALIIHSFHSYQLGKVYNFLLVLSSGLYAADFFRKSGLTRHSSALFAVAAALTPVTAAQLLTYYVDGALASLLTLAVMATVNLLFRQSRLDRLVFVAASSLAMAIKFTAVPYVAAIVCMSLLLQALPREFRCSLGCRQALKGTIGNAGIACLLGVLVIGFNPYVTNILQGQHPMYPVLGPNKIDIIAVTAPPSFLGSRYNAAEKFTISFFARSLAFSPCKASADGENAAIPGCHEPMKIPFTATKQEFISQGVPELHIAGWGLFFSGVTLCALALFVFGRHWKSNAPLVFALALIVVTTAMNPVSWWARYVPQFALVPVFLLVAVLRDRQRVSTIIARALCGFLVLDGILAAGAGAGVSFIKSRKLDQALAVVREAAGPGEYWAYRNPPRPGRPWAFSNPDSLVHYEQFSGHQGIVICAELDPPEAVLPKGGFPVGLNLRGATEVTLYKGSCSQGPPLRSGL